MAENGTRCKFGATLPSVIFGVSATNLMVAAAVLAQGAPTPQSNGPAVGSASYAPVPGALSSGRPPLGSMPGSTGYAPAGQSSANTLNAGYASLPLNATDASLRLDELKRLMSSARPKEFQEALLNYITWLSDVADGHWRMSTAFAKSDATRANAETEKQLALKFGALKRQGMLLQAQFLVSQRRFPEAVAPLIDIVVAEPNSATGESAYRLLQDIGFSELDTQLAAETGNGSRSQRNAGTANAGSNNASSNSARPSTQTKAPVKKSRRLR